MSKESLSDGALILGRPFMRTANTEIKMKEGSITMSVGDHFVHFNMYETMKQPHEDYSLLDIHFIDELHTNDHVEHGLISSGHMTHVNAHVIDFNPATPDSSIPTSHGCDVKCSSDCSLDYTSSTPCTTLPNDAMLVESSTNPSMLEKGVICVDSAGYSGAAKTHFTKPLSISQALRQVSTPVQVVCQIHTKPPPSEKPLKPKDGLGSTSLLPLHALSIDPTQLKCKEFQAQKSSFEVGDYVMAYVPHYSTPHEKFKETWIGPLEVVAKGDKRSYKLKDGYGGYFHTRANRLQLYHTSYKPP